MNASKLETIVEGASSCAAHGCISAVEVHDHLPQQSSLERGGLETKHERQILNELALFAGAGGGILGGKLLGWRTVCAVEYDEHARDVLKARQDDGCLEPFPIWDDVRTFDGRPWRGLVDVVSGGFPCQDISTAGGPNRKGLAGARSGLWAEMVRIIGEIRPRFVLVENSPALAFRGLGVVLGDLAALGYDAKWGVVAASDAGARHERERIWIVAYHWDADKNAACAQRGFYPPCQESIRALSEGVSPEPVMGRRADGVAGWMDRLERLGNGQVPAVVAKAWRLLAPELDDGSAFEECVSGLPKGEAVASEGRKYNSVLPKQ